MGLRPQRGPGSYAGQPEADHPERRKGLRNDSHTTRRRLHPHRGPGRVGAPSISRLSLVLPGSPISTIYEVVDDHHFALFFYCRTDSFNWVGERTDLHDVASVLFASTLRALLRVSCRLVNVLNPAIDVPSEIYGRYIVPIQPPLNAVPTARLSESTQDLLDSALQAQ